MATAIVLNGTSSSGKTTVAHAFQERAPRQFLNFSIDTILYALPKSALDRISKGADISDLRLPELIRAFYACVKELLDLGHDLVIDFAVTARYHAELLLAATESHEVILVGLDCSPAILREREQIRGDRRPGMAEQQQKHIHSLLTYDVFIDTTKMTADEAAALIVEALNSGSTGAIERTRRQLASPAQST